MGRRDDLHRLVHDLKNYVEVNRRGMMLPGAPPADDMARAEFLRREKAKQDAEIEKLKANLEPPEPEKQEQAKPDAPKQHVAPPSQPAQSASEQSTPSMPPREPKKERAPDTSGGTGALWKEFGSRPRPTYSAGRSGTSFVHYEQAWDDDVEDPRDKLLALRQLIGDCARCGLCEGRTNIVFGEGNPSARLMFVGEGPGYNEDKQARPFVGKAGELLDKMIVAMGLQREDTYICNVVKCRPPNNRDPEADEVAACAGFMIQQVQIVQPDVIVGLGKFAVNTLLKRDGALGEVRGKWHEFEGVPVMPTYHPAYLLRNENGKRPAWSDLQKVMGKLGL